VTRQWPLAAYSALALPLAMAMLPIYMMAPKFYSDSLGVSLTALGVTLFAVRLIDTAQDPLIGRLVDWLAKFSRGWAVLMVAAAVVLAIGFALLFMPSLMGPDIDLNEGKCSCCYGCRLASCWSIPPTVA
jgi:Na+/melibiose symporter-like transporter